MMKITALILTLFFALALFSCAGDNENSGPEILEEGAAYDFSSADPEIILANIVRSYRENGISSWWEIAALYNAGENPLDFPGFGAVLDAISGENYLSMASYVIAVNTALAVGSHAEYYEHYEEYKQKLTEFLANPDGDLTVNNHIFAYLALKTSGTEFDEEPFAAHLISEQKPDGGFAVFGNSGDTDMTAFAATALLLHNEETGTYSVVRPPLLAYSYAMAFLLENIGENGAFTSFGSQNANSTAVAMSALIGAVNENIALDSLAIFKLPDAPGYSFLEGGRPDALATAQAAIALADLINGQSFWYKLYQDSQNFTETED
jgi:hypothetical protein